MEVTVETREDPAKEIAESNLPAKVRYEWVVADVRTHYSLFRWSRILNAWLNCVLVLERGTRRSTISLERVSVVECVCHSQEGAKEGFFYMYMCHFSQLHMQVPFDDFTMGVLRLQNVRPAKFN